MSTGIGKNGWKYFSIPEVAVQAKRIAAKKDELFEAVAVPLGERFGMSFDRYDPAKAVEISVMKSIVRSLLRYDPGMLALAQAIYEHASPRFTEGFGELHAAPPYPYIHLPHDTSEFSKMHIDYSSHEGKFFTIWVPLNPCRHKPISIIPRSQAKWSAVRVLNAFERRLGIGELPWFHERLVSPDVELGDFMAWDGRTHHSGNLNESARTHVAVNFRLATSPHALEPSVKQRDFRVDSLGACSAVEPRGFIEVYFSVFESVRKAAVPLERDLGTAVRQTLSLIDAWKLDRAMAVRCSYGLTLGCIRRDSMLPEVARLNLAASLLSDEYLWSLNSFFDFAAGRFPPEALRELLDLLRLRFPSKQMEITSGSLAAKYRLEKSAVAL